MTEIGYIIDRKTKEPCLDDFGYKSNNGCLVRKEQLQKNRPIFYGGTKPINEAYGYGLIGLLHPKKTDTLKAEFNKYANQWKMETAGHSILIHKIKNLNYLYILAMGKDALPFILKDLEETGDDWFAALKFIARDNPVPKEYMGDIEKMREYWLKWGKINRLF